MLRKLAIVIGLLLCAMSCDKPIELPIINIVHHADYEMVEKIAVIVEPRQHALLVPVIKNAMQVLGNEWKIQVYHGTDNKDFLMNSELRPQIENKQIYLSNLSVVNITQPQYSLLMLQPYFWESVRGENILIFQTDSVLCGNSTRKIDEFLKFDYIGAPYRGHEVTCYIYQKNNRLMITSNRDYHPSQLRKNGARKITRITTRIGNGGLSLRKRSAALRVLEQFKPEGNFLKGAEDDYFSCVALDPRSGLNPVTFEEAMQFSAQEYYHPNAFGTHQPWFGLPRQDLHAMEQSCREVTDILKPYYLSRSDKWSDSKM